MKLLPVFSTFLFPSTMSLGKQKQVLNRGPMMANNFLTFMFICICIFATCGCRNNQTTHIPESDIQILARGINKHNNIEIYFKLSKNYPADFQPFVFMCKNKSTNATDIVLYFSNSAENQQLGQQLDIHNHSPNQFSFEIPVEKKDFPVNTWINGEKKLGKVSLLDN